MAVWMKPNSVSSGRVFSYYNNGPTIEFNLGGPSLDIRHANGTILDLATGIELTVGVWAHVVATRSGSTITAYKNGVQTAQNTSFAATFTADTSVRLGNTTFGNWPYWGMLDEAAIWNRGLTAPEVVNLYNAGAGIQYPF
jgi:hypothetical protein